MILLKLDRSAVPAGGVLRAAWRPAPEALLGDAYPDAAAGPWRRRLIDGAAYTDGPGPHRWSALLFRAETAQAAEFAFEETFDVQDLHTPQAFDLRPHGKPPSPSSRRAHGDRRTFEAGRRIDSRPASRARAAEDSMAAKAEVGATMRARTRAGRAPRATIAGVLLAATLAAGVVAGRRMLEDDAAADGAPASLDVLVAAETAARPVDASAAIDRSAYGVVSGGSGAALAPRRVAVVHADGRPAAGAEVVARPLAGACRPAAVRTVGQPVAGETRGWDVAAATGDDGCAVMTVRVGPCLVAARLGTLAGEAPLGPDDGVATPFVVRLLPTASFPVRVLDAAGRPAAGVDVRLRRRGAADDPRSCFGLATTGADGRARPSLALGDGADVDAEAVAIIACARPPTTPFRAVAPPEEIVVRLPETGAVVVETLTEDLAPCDADGVADLRMLADASDLAPPTVRVRLENGRARFPYVEAAGWAVCRIRVGDRTAVLEGRAPAPGQETTLVAHLASPHVRFVARLLDENGAPEPADRLECEAFAADGASLGRTEETEWDADGVVRAVLFFDAGLEPARVRWTRRGERRGKAEGSVPAENVDGERDCGDLRIDGGDAVCAGVVVDAGPHPASRITVAAHVFERRADGGTKRTRLVARCSETGAFRISAGDADVVDRYVELTLSGSDLKFADRVVARRGDVDVRIVVPRYGAIAGSFAPPPRDGGAQVVFMAWREGVAERRTAWTTDDGAFGFEDLPAGNWCVSGRLAAADPGGPPELVV
ncbi:MAG TPA: hypothetical protein VEI02_07330, partial [Planctomycetota bacterium]|nr:hypothetical protein [Planctomycetota bacterium]